MSFLIAVMALAAAATADVETDCPAGGDPSIARVRANWKTPLSPDDIMWAYPPQAAAARQGGKALLNCAVDVEGKANDCLVVSETPADQDFGAAALSLSPLMAFTPEFRCGKPVPTRVTIPINFSPPSAPKAAGVMPELTAQLLGRRLAVAMGFGDSAEAQMVAYGNTLGGSKPIPAEQRRAVYEIIKATRPKARQVMVEAAGVILAREMPLADLETAVAFYEGPAGKSLVRTQGSLYYRAGNELQSANLAVRKLLDTQFCVITGICPDETTTAAGRD